MIEWPQLSEVQEIKEMRLKEIRLFKLAQDDNFGSNIGAEFITNDGKIKKV